MPNHASRWVPVHVDGAGPAGRGGWTSDGYPGNNGSVKKVSASWGGGADWSQPKLGHPNNESTWEAPKHGAAGAGRGSWENVENFGGARGWDSNTTRQQQQWAGSEEEWWWSQKENRGQQSQQQAPRKSSKKAQAKSQPQQQIVWQEAGQEKEDDLSLRREECSIPKGAAAENESVRQQPDQDQSSEGGSSGDRHEEEEEVWEQRWVDPLKIRFSQEKIHPFFYKHGPIEKVLPEIQEELSSASECNVPEDKVEGPILRLLPPFEAIRCILPEGAGASALEPISLDNRRLYALQQAAVAHWPQRCAVLVHLAEKLPMKKRKTEYRKLSGGGGSMGPFGKVGNVHVTLSSRSTDWEVWGCTSVLLERLAAPQKANHQKAEFDDAVAGTQELIFGAVEEAKAAKKRVARAHEMVEKEKRRQAAIACVEMWQGGGPASAAFFGQHHAQQVLRQLFTAWVQRLRKNRNSTRVGPFTSLIAQHCEAQEKLLESLEKLRCIAVTPPILKKTHAKPTTTSDSSASASPNATRTGSSPRLPAQEISENNSPSPEMLGVLATQVAEDKLQDGMVTPDVLQKGIMPFIRVGNAGDPSAMVPWPPAHGDVRLQDPVVAMAWQVCSGLPIRCPSSVSAGAMHLGCGTYRCNWLGRLGDRTGYLDHVAKCCAAQASLAGLRKQQQCGC